MSNGDPPRTEQKGLYILIKICYNGISGNAEILKRRYNAMGFDFNDIKEKIDKVEDKIPDEVKDKAKDLATKENLEKVKDKVGDVVDKIRNKD